MARSTAEIQTDIALTRRLIEHQMDAMRTRLSDRWWAPYAVVAGAAAVGFLLARLPLLALVNAGARTVRTGLVVASALAAVERFRDDRHRREGDTPRAGRAA